VWVNGEDIAGMAAVVGMSVEEFEDEYVRRVGVRKSLIEYENGDCVFFDNKSRKCGVYSARPRQCRTWPFWDSNIRTPEAWAETCKACPGSGKGSLHQIEHIQREAAVIRI
jgi:Fe-S-cluster containining protein